MTRLRAALGRLSLTHWMLASLVAGAAFGFFAPGPAAALTPIADIFLRLFRAIIAPLLFGALVSAAAGADVRSLGRLGVRAVVYLEAASAVALLTGWAVVSILRPGDGVALRSAAPEAANPDFLQVLVNAFPSSILDAMARVDVLQIVVFSLLFGVAASLAGEAGRPVVAFAESLSAVCFRYTGLIMYIAPPAVFAAIAAAVSQYGPEVIYGLGRFVAAAWLAQAIYGIAVLGAVLYLAGIPLRPFWTAARRPVLLGFATTSSAVALPDALRAMEDYGIPRRITGFVMPIGLSFNPSGSAIHLAMAAFFVAQAAAIPLSWTQQAMILLTLKLTSKGVAGIPRANFVILSALFTSFGLPLEGLALLLGVDAVIDMVRTAVNVLGHCVAPAVIARWEGEHPLQGADTGKQI